MSDIRLLAFITISTLILIGTVYAISEAYLASSDPFSPSRTSAINVYFAKKLWGWTSAAFLILWATSPSSTRTARRVGKWFLATVEWAVFNVWFFGPAIIDRVVVASGGECILNIPEGDAMSVPTEYCFTKTTMSAEDHPHIFSATPLLTGFSATPRLRGGHDVSGHIFLLTMSVLFLADQLRPSIRSPESWSVLHKVAVMFSCVVLALSALTCWTTSRYFHSPSEKLSGYLLGVASFALTQLPLFEDVGRRRDPEKVH